MSAILQDALTFDDNLSQLKKSLLTFDDNLSQLKKSLWFSISSVDL